MLLVYSVDLNGENDATIVAEDDRHKLACQTNGIKHISDPVKNVYGISDRKALEEWYLCELRWFEKEYFDYGMFTLGTICVCSSKCKMQEKIIMYMIPKFVPLQVLY